MEAKELLRVLHTAERLKDETRHCYTSGGRRESVAEHSWRLALTALFLRDEFPALDMDRAISRAFSSPAATRSASARRWRPGSRRFPRRIAES